jgi:hypothetical protein
MNLVTNTNLFFLTFAALFADAAHAQAPTADLNMASARQ